MALAILGLVTLSDWVGPTPSFDEIRAAHRPSDVWLVDRHGEPLEALRTVQTHRSLEWIAIGEVSPAFVSKLVEAEDKRFFEHHGVDVRALLNAFRQGVMGRGLRGASTLTMQVAKSFDEASAEGRSSNGVFLRTKYKLRQIVRAVKLDFTWSKNQILEAYVNRASFRGEVVGLRAASLGFLGKSPAGLGEMESAILAVMLRAPNATLDKIELRACRLLKLSLADPGCLRAANLAREIIENPFKLVRERQIVPVVSERFIEAGAGKSVIQTSLDARIQTIAVNALREQLKSLKKQNVQDAAVVVLETRTGRPIAYVGNGGRGNSSAPQIDGVKSRRQLGSTIKAFVYGTAYDLGVISPTSLILDSPENVAVGNGQVYQPRNYDYLFRGQVGAAEALGSSLNVPAVRVLGMVGERRVVERLRALGFEDLKDENDYGPSLALGTVDASLWELAQGYRKLSLYADSKVFSDEAKHQVFESLSIAENRRFTFGVESLLQLPFAVAAKTGTSKDMRDNWCVGFTSEYTVAAWVGNFNGEPMWNVSGITGAAPLWRQIMLALHRDHPPRDEMLNYRKPDAPIPLRTITKIRYPVPDMLIGLDPDIPKRLQKIPLRLDGYSKGLTFYMNGRRLGPANREPFWSPVKGKQRLELRNGQGKTIDQVQFLVR